MGLNRISWKLPGSLPGSLGSGALPMGLNRISWKPVVLRGSVHGEVAPLPMGLNRISWKH